MGDWRCSKQRPEEEWWTKKGLSFAAVVEAPLQTCSDIYMSRTGTSAQTRLTCVCSVDPNLRSGTTSMIARGNAASTRYCNSLQIGCPGRRVTHNPSVTVSFVSREHKPPTTYFLKTCSFPTGTKLWNSHSCIKTDGKNPPPHLHFFFPCHAMGTGEHVIHKPD